MGFKRHQLVRLMMEEKSLELSEALSGENCIHASLKDVCHAFTLCARIAHFEERPDSSDFVVVVIVLLV